jgi:hypothetical protein
VLTIEQIEFDLVELELWCGDSLGEKVSKVVIQWDIVHGDTSSLDIIIDKTFLDAEVFKSSVVGEWWFLNDVESRLVIAEDVSQQIE